MSRIIMFVNPTRAPFPQKAPEMEGMKFTAGAGRLDILAPGSIIDWGDGSPLEIEPVSTVTHTYIGAGPWNGSIDMVEASEAENYMTGPALISIDAWPNSVNLPVRLAFSHWSTPSINLVSVPETTPPGVRNVSGMFRDTRKFNADISNWNIDNPTDMSNMFFNAIMFNRDLSGWCVQNIQDEPYQFSAGATAWTLPKPNWGAACT